MFDSALVSVDHPLKDQSIYSYLKMLPQHAGVLGIEMQEAEMTKKSELKNELFEVVRKK